MRTKEKEKKGKNKKKKALLSAPLARRIPAEEVARYRKRKKRARIRHRIQIAFATLAFMYCMAVFSEIPVLAKWRTIYIETAMSTKTHQWLATAFIPGFVIDKVMAQNSEDLNAQKNLKSNWGENIEINVKNKDPKEDFFTSYWELNSESFKQYFDSHPELIANGYDHILIEDLDHELGLMTSEGDNVLVVDTENHLLIVGIDGEGYHSKMAIIKDPAQVDLAKADQFGTVGQQVSTFAENNDALIAINASRFVDIGGHGNGGSVKGSFVIDGQEYSKSKNGYWRFAGFTKENRMNVDSYKKIDVSEYKWGLEVYPALIINGQDVVDGTLGMGIQPRTSVGQAKNGDFLMLVVEGRLPGYSLGCAVSECSNILMRYGAYQALNLDGGSSSVMYYNGEQITKACSVSGTGRYLPNAFIARKAANVDPSDRTPETDDSQLQFASQ